MRTASSPDVESSQHMDGETVSVAANPGEVTIGFGGVTEMQKLTPAACKTATVGTEGQLIDTRDNKIYWVARLKDNNCWMTQNLDYDDGNSTKVATPSGWTNTTATYRAYYDPGNYYLNTPIDWKTCGNGNGTGLMACPSNWNTDGDAHYHAGNYYSWAAATNNSSNSITSGNATGSICPTNWKLPTGNSDTASGSFGLLVSGLGSGATWANAITSAPYYFVPGGCVYSGNLYVAGGLGYYWSSTAYDGSQAYNLYFDSSSVNPSSVWYRYIGFSVRCLVQGS